jgi:hypothetical protein
MTRPSVTRFLLDLRGRVREICNLGDLKPDWGREDVQGLRTENASGKE